MNEQVGILVDCQGCNGWCGQICPDLPQAEAYARELSGKCRNADVVFFDVHSSDGKTWTIGRLIGGESA